MAGIQYMSRVWSDIPSIVSVVTSDNLYTITQSGYLTAQASNIAAINNGAFSYQSYDYALVAYSGGQGWFLIDTVNNTFKAASVAQYAAVKLTSAQILGAYAAPVQIIPAQGAHTIVVVNNVFVEFDYGTTQFAAGGAAGLQYDSTVHLAGTAATATVAAATINGFAANNGFTLAGAATGTMASMVNKGIYWSNATGAFTTGDSSMILNVRYDVFSTIA